MLKFVGMTLPVIAMCLSACGPIKTHVRGCANLSNSAFLMLIEGSRSAIDPTESWLNICDESVCKTAIHWARGTTGSIKISGNNITMRIIRSPQFIKINHRVKLNSVVYNIKFIATEAPIPEKDIPGDIKVANNCGSLRDL